MKNEGKTPPISNKLFYGALILAVVIFFTALSVVNEKRAPILNDNTTPVGVNSITPTTTPVSLTTSTEQRGKFLVITTKTTNNTTATTKRELNVYIKDSTGNKHFIDKVYVNLNAGETGKSESSKKISELGPPPHEVITEWKK